jgi:hypothetical protein
VGVRVDGSICVAGLFVACSGAQQHPEAQSAHGGVSAAASSARPTIAEIAARARPSVVVIRTDAGLGTGFVVAPKVVATNLHVLANAHSAELVFFDGTHSMAAGVLNVDATHDLALLAMPESGPTHTPLAFGDDRRLRAGDAVVALGTPQGLDFTVSTGVVGAVREVNSELTLLQITAPISRGSSGGPLLDDEGVVVGVTTLMMVNGQNLNFAVPARYVQALLARPPSPRSLTQQASAKRTPGVDPRNVLITQKPYPEAVAGFKLGMTITDTRHACPGTVTEKKNYLECSIARVPVPFASGPVSLYLSNGRLISVKLVATSALEGRIALTERYGTPYDWRVAFNAAIDRGDFPGPNAPKKIPVDQTVHLRWSFAHGGGISLDERSPRRVEVLYTAPVWDDAGNY